MVAVSSSDAELCVADGVAVSNCVERPSVYCRSADCAEKVELPSRVILFPSGARVLLVGEGDFVFSEALVSARQTSPPWVVATSLDSEEEVIMRYADARRRLMTLREAGAELHFGVDARHLSNVRPLAHQKYDRIVFNFPLLPMGMNPLRGAGSDIIVANRLMMVAFLRAAAPLLESGGLVVIANKDCYPYSWWRIESLPEWSGGALSLAAELAWDVTEYPQLYAGPCNVNRDAAVKPTDATIFLFEHNGSDRLGGGNGSGNDRHGFAHLDRRGVLRSFRKTQWNCKLCGLYGLPKQEELAAHEAGKIHKKRVGLEQRWAKAFKGHCIGEGSSLSNTLRNPSLTAQPPAGLSATTSSANGCCAGATRIGLFSCLAALLLSVAVSLMLK